MKKKNGAKSILVKVVIIIIIITIAVLLLTLPIFKVSSIEVTGNDKLSSIEIIQKTKLQKGRNIFLQRYFKSIYELDNVNKIKDFSIKPKFPDKIVIDITEREERYQISTNDGYYIVDDQGYILNVSDEKTGLIMLTGLSSNKLEDKSRLDIEDLYILDGINNIYSNAEERELKDLITEIGYDGKEYIINFESENKIARIKSPIQDLMAQFTMIKKIIDDRKGATGEIFLDKNEKRTYMIFREKI